MSRFLGLVAAIGLLIAANPARATQGMVYQGFIGTSVPGSPYFFGILGMAVLPNGRLAVAYETETGEKVAIYDESGDFVRMLSFDLLTPQTALSGMAVDSTGRFIFLIDNFFYFVGELDIYSSDGKFVTSKNVGSDSDYLALGSANSIIVSGAPEGPNCQSSATIFGAKLNTLSSFNLNDCIVAIASLGSSLLAENNDGQLKLLNYSGKTLGSFPLTGTAVPYSPIATPPAHNRAFFLANTGTLAAPKTGVGIFDGTGKLLQQVPYSQGGVQALAATSATSFFVVNPHQPTGVQRFAMGTLPPLPVAKPISATVKPGQNATITVTKYALHGPFHDLSIAKVPSKGAATVTSLNTIKYTAKRTASGSDTFTYTVWNSTGSSTATVTVTIP